MAYPSPEGTAAIQRAATDLSPSDLVGNRVAVATRTGRVYHGTLETVSPEGTLTISLRDGWKWKRFHVLAEDVKSCKQILFERRSPRR